MSGKQSVQRFLSAVVERWAIELPLGRFPAPSERAAVSARIDEMVFQTLEKERELRQQSAAEVNPGVTCAGRSRTAAAAESFHSPSRGPSEDRGLSKMAPAAGVILSAAAVVFTHGSTQRVILALAMNYFILVVQCFSAAQRREERPHLIVGGGSVGEGRREFRFHVLAETLAHPAHGLAQRGCAFAAGSREGGEIAVGGFAADEWQERGELFLLPSVAPFRRKRLRRAVQDVERPLPVKLPIRRQRLRVAGIDAG